MKRSHRTEPSPRAVPAAPPLVAALLVALAGCGGEGRSEPEARPPEGAVAAGTPEAARAGLEILARGGNAVDAAVATALAQGVSEPGNAGLGGWGVALVRVPGSDPVAVDVPFAAGDGEGSGTPTLVALLHHLWRTYGSGAVSWAELVEPAERLAREGYILRRHAHRTLVQEYARLERDSAAAALTLTPERAIPAEASQVTNPELADVLRRLGEEGASSFYGGEIGRRAAQVMEGREPGSRAFGTAPSPRERPAVGATFAGWRVWVPPEPHGGPELLRALEFMEGAPGEVWTAPAPVRTMWLAEGLAHAFGSSQGAEAHLASIPRLPLPDSGFATAREEGGETTHLSVADGEGMLVALTQTLGEAYGAGWPLDGLGFFAGRKPTAARPVTGRSDTADAPASRPEERQWLAPTVVTRGDSAYLALGSPGGRPAISALAQVLASWLQGGVPLEEAVGAPRVHVGIDGEYRGRLYLEGMVSAAADTVRMLQVPTAWGDSVMPLGVERGFRMGERDSGLLRDGRDPWFGSVTAVGRSGEEWWLVSDPRRDGAALRLEGGLVPSSSAITPTGGGEALPLLPGG